MQKVKSNKEKSLAVIRKEFFKIKKKQRSFEIENLQKYQG